MKLVGAVIHVEQECMGTYNKVAKNLKQMKEILIADGWEETRLGFYRKIDVDGEVMIASFVDLELD